MSPFPNIERRDSGPAHLDRTSDEWFGVEPEDDEDDDLTDDAVEGVDSMAGLL